MDWRRSTGAETRTVSGEFFAERSRADATITNPETRPWSFEGKTRIRRSSRPLTGVVESAGTGAGAGVYGGILDSGGLGASAGEGASIGAAVGGLGTAFAEGANETADETRRILLNCLRTTSKDGTLWTVVE